MTQNLTFEPDPHSRKATRYFLGLQVGAIIVVLGLIALQVHALAFGVLFLALVMTSMRLRWLHGRYQASDLVKEKGRLQQEASRLKEKLVVVQKSLTETKERREHLLHKEQFGLEATLQNQQTYHVQKGLSSCSIKDETLSGLVPELKERLERAGIRTALDISDEALSPIEGVDAANREALLQWRSSLCAQFEETQPIKLPDHQLEYIQKKFNRLHARNDERERGMTEVLQQFEDELSAIHDRLQPLEAITFRSYLVHTLLAK